MIQTNIGEHGIQKYVKTKFIKDLSNCSIFLAKHTILMILHIRVFENRTKHEQQKVPRVTQKRAIFAP